MHLYAFGANGSGQLGLGHRQDVPRPELCKVPENHSPKRIAAGGNATSILFASGDVNDAGLIFQDPEDLWSRDDNVFPTFRSHTLAHQQSAKLSSATWEANITVTTNDTVDVQGRGSKGELGAGPGVAFAAQPLRLDRFAPEGTEIVDLASSVSHTVVVLSNGEVYGWGNGRKGQLGEPPKIVWKPRKVEGLNDVGFHIVRAVCGREFTYLVGGLASGGHHHVILGSDRWGVKSQMPARIPDNWKDVGASWSSIFALNNDGEVHSWGRNDRGQLAPAGLPALEQIAVGSEHVVALTQKGEVVTWGWGEHGNCGPSTDADGDVKGRSAEIEMPLVDGSNRLERVRGVGAGCATSFFWTE